jgi:hypothetical protein
MFITLFFLTLQSSKYIQWCRWRSQILSPSLVVALYRSFTVVPFINYSVTKYAKKCLFLAKKLFWALAKMCHCAAGLKLNLKKMCSGANKKYRRVGNECRLTRCPFKIWSVCWSPVKMVCLCIYVQFLVVCFLLHGRLLALLITSACEKTPIISKGCL